MSVSGDHSTLAALGLELELRADAMRTLPGRAAEAIAAVSAAQLGAGLSPYGEPSRARHDAATRVQISAGGAGIVAAADWSGLIPSDARGLPPAWQSEIDRVVDEAMGGR